MSKALVQKEIFLFKVKFKCIGKEEYYSAEFRVMAETSGKAQTLLEEWLANPKEMLWKYETWVSIKLVETERVIVKDQPTSNVPDTNVGEIQQPTSDGWIPVSERLPDENMWCLVTYQSGKVEKVKYCTTNNWGQNDECITAWQPLPPAYKESE